MIASQHPHHMVSTMTRTAVSPCAQWPLQNEREYSRHSPPNGGLARSVSLPGVPLVSLGLIREVPGPQPLLMSVT